MTFHEKKVNMVVIRFYLSPYRCYHYILIYGVIHISIKSLVENQIIRELYQYCCMNVTRWMTSAKIMTHDVYGVYYDSDYKISS